MRDFKTIIGIEVHAELDTKTKAFCGCRNEYGAMPNTLVCPVCLGLPGAIPSVNRQAIEKTIKAGLILNSSIAEDIVFERKNFFAPDMPKGFQYVQYSKPICVGGSLRLKSGKVVPINRVHLEEDSAKMIHDHELNKSLIDFNRSGVPVLEIVTDPIELNSSEVVEFIHSLRQSLVFGGVANCRSEHGEYRFDVNISVARAGEEFGTRVELKNLSSSKQLELAIDYESNRQISIIKEGDLVERETRVWSDEMQKTYAVRQKENVNDYRHIVDPDIKPIKIMQSDIDRIKEIISETYESRVNRYLKLGLSNNYIDILTSEKFISDYFDETNKLLNSPTDIARWISQELLRTYKQHNKATFESLISPEDLVAIVQMEQSGDISTSNAKVLFDKVVETGKSAESLAKELEIVGKVSDAEIDDVVEQIIAGNLDIISDFRDNPSNVMNYFVGKVKTMTGGRADAQTVKTRTSDRLKK